MSYYYCGDFKLHEYTDESLILLDDSRSTHADFPYFLYKALHPLQCSLSLIRNKHTKEYLQCI